MPRRAEVDAWFAEYAGPMKELMLRVREIVLGADPRVDECIKWKTPTFTYRGNIASFNPRAKRYVSLLFHTGAQIPGVHPLLVGEGSTARYASLPDAATVEREAAALTAIVRAWCESRS